MTWNYRVIKETQDGETTYCIYEVYYNDDGQIEVWSAGPVCAQGETLAELAEDLMMMLRNIGKHPVLDMEELRKQFPETPRKASRGGAR